MNLLMIAGGNDRIFIFLALHLMVVVKEKLNVFNICVNMNIKSSKDIVK